MLITYLLCRWFTDAQASSPSANACPLLGSNVTTQFTRPSRNKLFMNFGAPAQCNGTVTSWHYCSYNQYLEDNEDCEGTESYTSIFLVYRQTGPSTYQRVAGSSKSVTISLNCPSDGGFRCDRSQTLSPSEQFDIQENDIVAACLRNFGFIANPIQLVGEQSSGPSSQVYWYDGNNYETCSDSQLETIDIQNSAFTLDSGVYRLHLHAEIDSKPSYSSKVYFNCYSHYCYNRFSGSMQWWKQPSPLHSIYQQWYLSQHRQPYQLLRYHYIMALLLLPFTG